MLRKDNDQSRSALETKRCPKIPQHPTRIAVSAIKNSGADGICHVWRDEEPVHSPTRCIRHATSHISLVRLRRPNAQRNLIHLLPPSCAIERSINFTHRPNNSPTEEALVDPLPRRGTRVAMIITVVPNLRVLRRHDLASTELLPWKWRQRWRLLTAFGVGAFRYTGFSERPLTRTCPDHLLRLPRSCA
jgi:hypothetical protein